jgi:hypothetical protein
MDALVVEFAFDHGDDLQAHGFCHSVLVMFACSVLWHGPFAPYGAKRFRIAEARLRTERKAKSEYQLLAYPRN